MRTTTYLCAALLLGVTPVISAATDTTGCYVKTSAATALGGYYVVGTLGEIWEETNGISGLQRRDSGCDDGRTLASDTCWFMGPDGLVRCSAQSASSAQI